MPIRGFQHQKQTERYLKQLQEHLRPRRLELNEQKTRLIRFGRFCSPQTGRARRRETGDVHLSGLRPYLRDIAKQLRRRMHEPVATIGAWPQNVLRGYYQHHAVPGNLHVLSPFPAAACGSGGVFSAGAVNSGGFGIVRVATTRPIARYAGMPAFANTAFDFSSPSRAPSSGVISFNPRPKTSTLSASV